MRWFSFCILLYLAAALQMAHLGALSEHGYFHVEFLPVLVVFYALFADESRSLLCSLIVGLVYDLTSTSLLGTHIVILALVAWVISRVRMSIFRYNMISQTILTLLAVMFTLSAADILAWLAPMLIGGPRPPEMSFWPTLGVVSSTGIYTAVLAPWLFKLAFLMGPLLGFESENRRRWFDG